MQEGSEFIVMTAVSSYKCCGCYAKVALCEVEKGVVPKMISTRAKGMVFIWELHTHLRKGRSWSSSSYAYEKTLARMTVRCAELNERAARCSA